MIGNGLEPSYFLPPYINQDTLGQTAYPQIILTPCDRKDCCASSRIVSPYDIHNLTQSLLFNRLYAGVG